MGGSWEPEGSLKARLLSDGGPSQTRFDWIFSCKRTYTLIIEDCAEASNPALWISFVGSQGVGARKIKRPRKLFLGRVFCFYFFTGGSTDSGAISPDW